MLPRQFAPLVLAVLVPWSAFGADGGLTFDLTQLPKAPYDDAAGFGYETGIASAGSPDFYFSIKAAEGNYDVTVVLGSADAAADTTVKAELRRLMAGPVQTAAGSFRTVRFVVNVRQPKFGDGQVVRLKPREKTGEIFDWDGKLTLEFDGRHPAVKSIAIAPAKADLPTIFLAGDSTVCDQPYEPYCSWGQMATAFFGPGVAVANHAESGESLRSFIGERRLAKLDTVMRPGDYLLVEMGHNDQKERGPGVGAMTSFKGEVERFVADARAHGVTPVLVTPVSRRTFGDDGKIRNSLGDFPAAMRVVAQERHVALIDLNALSTTLYESLGAEGAKALFPTVHGTLEGTHHNDYGAYEIAQCVLQGIRDAHLPIAKFIRKDVPSFDPSHPDPVTGFPIPPSPRAAEEKPYGN